MLSKVLQNRIKRVFVAVFIRIVVVLGFVSVCFSAFAEQRPTLSKNSVYLNAKDKAIAERFFQRFESGKFADAYAIASKSSQAAFRTLASWLVLQKTSSHLDISHYQDFLTHHSDWPQLELIQRRAESSFGLDITKDQIVLDFFSGRKPVSAWGKLRLGLAYYRLGDKQKGITAIREGYSQATLSSEQLRGVLQQGRQVLITKCHVQRANNLAWQERYHELKAMLPLLPNHQRHLFKARYLLITQSPGVDTAIRRVSTALQRDEGLLFDRFKWRIKKQKYVLATRLWDEVVQQKIQLDHGDYWLRYNTILARHYLQANQSEDAYRALLNHQAHDNAVLSEAEWLAGWLALRYMGDPESAEQHFLSMNAVVSYPISKARAAYWLGRTYHALEDAKKSHHWYKEASQYPLTFYGQLAAYTQGIELSIKGEAVSRYWQKNKNFVNTRKVKVL